MQSFLRGQSFLTVRSLVQSLTGAPVSATPVTKVTSFHCPPCWLARAVAIGVGRNRSASVSGTMHSFGEYLFIEIQRHFGVSFGLCCFRSCVLWRPRLACPREAGRPRFYLPFLGLLFMLPPSYPGGLYQEVLPIWWHLEWNAALLYR